MVPSNQSARSQYDTVNILIFQADTDPMVKLVGQSEAKRSDEMMQEKVVLDLN